MNEAKEKHQTTLIKEVASKRVIVMEAREQAVAEFKESEDLKLTTQDYEVGYDNGVEEAFFNI